MHICSVRPSSAVCNRKATSTYSFVSKRQTTRDEKQRLVDRLLAISGRSTPDGPLRRVELTIVVESEVNPWRYPPSFDFQYGDWLRSEFESGNVEPWTTTTNPDLAALDHDGAARKQTAPRAGAGRGL